MENKKERVLFIVESPNKVASLKSFLPKNYVVMASVGHISGIKDGSGYHNTGIDVEDGFKPDFEVSKDKKEVVAKLKEQVKLADKVCLATDPDREGEAIAWSLRKFLKIPDSKYQRITYHEITKNAVLKALDNPRKIDEDLVSASHARQEWDKMLGYRMSTIGRNNVGAKSVGRCQSAGLLLIANKEDEIKSFVPECYGELVATLSKGNQEIGAKYIREDGKRPSYEECFRASENIDKSLKAGGMFKAIKVERKTSKENPKPPFCTATFQQEASSQLNMTVNDAQSCAQNLFEGIEVNGKHISLISYHRTDSEKLSDEFVEQAKAYIVKTLGRGNLYAGPQKTKAKANAQEGHEALRVIDLGLTPSKLSEYLDNERLVRVYGLIWRRTIQSLLKPAIYSTDKVTFEICGYHFVSEMKTLVELGYKEIK